MLQPSSMSPSPLRAGVLALCVAACGGARAPASSPSPLLGRPFPDFRRPAVEGPAIDTAGARGRVMVVKFFAKYCIPCQRTLPLAEAVHHDHPEVVFIGVSEDETEEQALAQIRQYELSFPVVVDRGNVLAGRLRAVDLPVVFVVGPSGKIRWVGGPEQAGDELEGAVRAASSD